MASIVINAAMHKLSLQLSSSHHTNKEPSQVGTTPSFRTKKTTTIVALNVEGQMTLNTHEEQNHNNRVAIDDGAETSSVKFADERWKHGTWDLNMFVKSGKMDWDALIVAEARRRKFLELYPEKATNQDPVLFRSSLIPWWACFTHSHLPEIELLNEAFKGVFVHIHVSANDAYAKGTCHHIFILVNFQLTNHGIWVIR